MAPCAPHTRRPAGRLPAALIQLLKDAVDRAWATNSSLASPALLQAPAIAALFAVPASVETLWVLEELDGLIAVCNLAYFLLAREAAGRQPQTGVRSAFWKDKLQRELVDRLDAHISVAKLELDKALHQRRSCALVGLRHGRDTMPQTQTRPCKGTTKRWEPGSVQTQPPRTRSHPQRPRPTPCHARWARMDPTLCEGTDGALTGKRARCSEATGRAAPPRQFLISQGSNLWLLEASLGRVRQQLV